MMPATEVDVSRADVMFGYLDELLVYRMFTRRATIVCRLFHAIHGRAT